MGLGFSSPPFFPFREISTYERNERWSYDEKINR
jgi:hypothetical protein